MVEAIKSDSVPIGILGRFAAEAPAIILIYLMQDLQNYLNISVPMTGGQMAQTADLICSDYDCRNLKPEDYKVIFSGIKKGEYGKIFNRVDGEVIFGAIRSYIERRNVWVEENNYRQHKHLKENENSNLIHPEVVEMYKQLLKTVEAVEEKPLPREKSKPAKSERDLEIQRLFTDFEGLPGETIGHRKFVNGLDQVEYVELKIKEYDLHKGE